jgi:hypothetical protein
MKFFKKNKQMTYIELFKKHLIIVNYSLNINLKKNYKLLVKKKISV